METECTAGTLPFQSVARRTVQARFDGGALTSDGGAVLLREVDRATGILAQFAACFRDAREPARIPPPGGGAPAERAPPRRHGPRRPRGLRLRAARGAASGWWNRRQR